MASSLSSKHIPTLLGVFVLIAGLIGGIFLANSATTGFLPRASAETTPKNLKITNVTDTSFTVSWTTDAKITGYIKYGQSGSNLSLTITDDRDQLSGSTGLFHNHHVTVRGLTASTTYYFKIGSSSNYLYDNNGQPYQTTTAGAITSNAKTLYGQVLNASQTGLSGALVYVSSDSMAPISALTQSTGSFVISLAQARTKDLKQAATLNDTTTLNVLVMSGDDSSSSVIKASLSQSQPLPDIVIGTNQDLTTSAAPVQATSAPDEQLQSKFTAQLLAPPTETVSTSSAVAVSVVSPVSGTMLTTAKPTFSGTASKATKIALQIIGPSTISTSVTSNSSGKWTYTASKALLAGEYSVSATATSSGQTTSDQKTFTITLPTATPRATSMAQPVASVSALPASGSTEITLILFFAGILLVGSGFAFIQARAET